MSRAAFYRWRRREQARQSCGCRAAASGSGAARSRRGCAAWKKRTRKTDRSKEQMDSYDVRFWDIRKLGNGSTARFRVRWAVDGREHCKSFKARPLADGFLDGLKEAVRDRRPFNPRTGLPDAETIEEEMITWYAARPRVRRGQVAESGPSLPPLGRRGPGHRHHRPHRQGAGRARAQGAAAGAVRLGVQPGHPRHRPAARDRRRPRLGRAGLAARRRPGGHRHGAARAGRLCP